ncbi:MAG: A/G-specific adenine glycosylase [Burkholderiaceae bacterium]|nr:A/G-specific adenine glycosylase [Burkholderiaceae bacterium]
MRTTLPTLSEQVVHWQVQHGRHSLPWQQTRDPYRVWLSEVMLQQTQVTTVLDYYRRFLLRFPDVVALAQACEDDVLALWSGLGYYSRACNLHRCARMVVEKHNGSFPPSAQALAMLPGIGRSTAAAIAAFCFSERVAILDANVRRVLTRWLGFDADLSVAAHERMLWNQAQALLPHDDLEQAMPRYTQGLMDIGATICLPRKPACGQCPIRLQCVALRQEAPERYPVKTRKLVRKAAAWWLLLLRDDRGRIHLHKRPSSGIWAGLHCLPVFSEHAELVQYLAAFGAAQITELPSFTHVLTHRDLHLHPIAVQVSGAFGLDTPRGWFGSDQWQHMGLPAPVRKLLEQHSVSL